MSSYSRYVQNGIPDVSLWQCPLSMFNSQTSANSCANVSVSMQVIMEHTTKLTSGLQRVKVKAY